MIQPRRSADDRGIRLGLNRNFRTDDPEFDRALYVAFDGPTNDLLVLMTPELRRDLIQLLYGGSVLTLVATTAAEATLTLSVSRRADDVSSDARGAAIADALAAIASRLPAFHPSKRPARAVWAEGLIVLGALSPLLSGLGMAGTISAWPIFVGWEYYLATAVVGLVAALFACVPMFVLSRGLAHGWFNFKVYIVFMLISGPFASATVIRFVNCAFDDGPTRTRVVEVVGKRTSYSSKSGTHHTLILRSWRPGGDTEELSSSAALNTEAALHNQVVLRTRPGLLGAEWLVGFGTSTEHP